MKILCQYSNDVTKEGTWVTIVEQISSTLEGSVIFPKGRFIKAAQVCINCNLVSKLEVTASPYCDVVDTCNLRTFQGKLWYYQSNPTQPVGSGCRSSWEECQVDVNSKKFDRKYWVYPTNQKLPISESYSTNWITYDNWSRDCLIQRQYTNMLNGLGFIIDKLYFSVSQEPVNGEWDIMGDVICQDATGRHTRNDCSSGICLC